MKSYLKVACAAVLLGVATVALGEDDARAFTVSGMTLTFGAGASDVTNAIWLCWGAADGGTLTNGWANVVKVAEVTPEPQTVVVTPPADFDAGGDRYRFMSAPREIVYLAYDYPVAYVESTGGQYVNTGIRPTSTLSTAIRLSAEKDFASENAILGAKWDVDGYFLMFFKAGYNYVRFHSGRYVVQDSQHFVFGFSATNEIVVSRTGLTVNDALTGFLSIPGTDKDDDIYLFSTPDNEVAADGAGKRGVFRLYSCSFTDGDQLVRDYVPVVAHNGSYALYDRVSGDVFVSTGEELGGGPRVPGPATRTKCCWSDCYGGATTDAPVVRSISCGATTDASAALSWIIDSVGRGASSADVYVSWRTATSHETVRVASGVGAGTGNYVLSALRSATDYVAAILVSNDLGRVTESSCNFTTVGYRDEQGNGRTISVSPLKAEGRMTGLRLQFGPSAANVAIPLYALLGSSWGGNSTNGWARVDFVANIAPEEETLDYALPAGWGEDFSRVRFAFLGGGDIDGAPDADRVDYIESDGTQAINTGIKPSTGLVTEIELQPLEGHVGENAIFGASWAANGYFLMFYNSKYRFHSRGKSVDVAISAYDRPETLSCSPTAFVVGGVAHALAGTQSDSSNDITLFQSTSGTGDGKGGAFRMYRCSMRTDKGPERDFVPCLHNGDYCLFDSVSKGYFTDGSGGNPFKVGYVFPRDAFSPTYEYGSDGGGVEIAEFSLVSRAGTIADVTGRVALGDTSADEIALVFRYGMTDDVSAMKSYDAGHPESDGSFAFTVEDFVPGARNWYALELVRDDVVVARKGPHDVQTDGPAALGEVWFDSVTDDFTLNFQADVIDVGAGNASLRLLTGPTADSLAAAGDAVAVPFADRYALSATLPTFTNSLAWAVLLSNSAGGRSWCSTSAVGVVSCPDRTAYRWTGGSSGDWRDAANWSSEAHPGDSRYAFPDYLTATADFSACADSSVEVRVSGETHASVKGADGTTVTFVGADADALLVGQVCDGILKGTNAFSGLRFAVSNDVTLAAGARVICCNGACGTWGGNVTLGGAASFTTDAATNSVERSVTFGPGARFTLAHGACVTRPLRDKGEDAFVLTSAGAVLEVAGGSVCALDRTVLANGAELIIDDATGVVHDAYYSVFTKSALKAGEAPGRVVLRGRAPRFEDLSGHCVFANMTDDFRVDFEPSSEPWEQAAWLSGSNAMLEQMNIRTGFGSVNAKSASTGSSVTNHWRVGVVSPRRLPPGQKIYHLVDSLPGTHLTTNTLDFVTKMRTSDRLYYTYDYSERTEPAVPGDLPTGLRLLVCPSGLAIVVY